MARLTGESLGVGHGDTETGRGEAAEDVTGVKHREALCSQSCPLHQPAPPALQHPVAFAFVGTGRHACGPCDGRESLLKSSWSRILSP